MPKLKALEQLAIWRERYPAPCQAACPVHTDVRSYVTLTAQRRFDEAYLAARGPNPLPAICGRACSAPCEDVCTRREFDRPLPIRRLKRFLSDRYHVPPALVPTVQETGCTVAVVGAGPTGLAAAHDLALLGHRVAVYEAAPEPGGMAILGVPRFRLAHQAIRGDVRDIEALGVVIHNSTRVGRDISLATLRRENDVVLVAAGAMRPNELDVPAVDLPGVVQALSFLEEANLGGRPACGNQVAVIGGGYTAIDAARTALRLGAEVTVLYRRTRSESEVHAEELDETLHEGVRIEYLVSPVRVVDDGHGRAGGVEFIRNALGEPDGSGRPRPLAIPGSEFVHPCDMVILALGQSPDAHALDPELANVLRNVDRARLMTPVAGVFAAGDFVTGPSTIIEAVADGRAAASAIHRYLAETRAPLKPWPEAPETWPVAPVALPPPGTAMRRAPGELSLVAEVEDPPEVAWAVSDSLRCLYCGLVPRVVFDRCTACQDCALACPVDCISRVALNLDNSTRPIANANDVIVYEIRGDECIRCGRCFGACPTGAIVVEGFDWD